MSITSHYTLTAIDIENLLYGNDESIAEFVETINTKHFQAVITTDQATLLAEQLNEAVDFDYSNNTQTQALAAYLKLQGIDLADLFQMAGIPTAFSGDNITQDLTSLIEEFVDAYQGTFTSDAEFAQETAESLGVDLTAQAWPLNCIDWSHAARELMYDYSEQDGFYFRNV